VLTFVLVAAVCQAVMVALLVPFVQWYVFLSNGSLNGSLTDL
jgi:hypothetical protein